MTRFYRLNGFPYLHKGSVAWVLQWNNKGQIIPAPVKILEIDDCFRHGPKPRIMKYSYSIYYWCGYINHNKYNRTFGHALSLGDELFLTRREAKLAAHRWFAGPWVRIW